MKNLIYFLGIIIFFLVWGCKSEDNSSNNVEVTASKCNEGLTNVLHYDGLTCGELNKTNESINISNVYLNCAFSKSYAKVAHANESVEIVVKYDEQGDIDYLAKCSCYFDFVIPIDNINENINKIDIKFIDMANNVEEELVINPQNSYIKCKYTVYGYKFGIDHNTSGIENLHRYCNSEEDCGSDLICKTISDNNSTKVCMKKCSENNDCPYNNILMCKEEVCTIKSNW